MIEGEVLAFDAPTKMLVLKSSASNKRSALSDVHFLNLAMVKDVTVRHHRFLSQVTQTIEIHRYQSKTV